MENQNKRKKKGKELKAERRKTRRILGKTRDHLDFGAARSLSISRFCALGLCRRRRRARVFFLHTHTHTPKCSGWVPSRARPDAAERKRNEEKKDKNEKKKRGRGTGYKYRFYSRWKPILYDAQWAKPSISVYPFGQLREEKDFPTSVG